MREQGDQEWQPGTYAEEMGLYVKQNPQTMSSILTHFTYQKQNKTKTQLQSKIKEMMA